MRRARFIQHGNRRGCLAILQKMVRMDTGIVVLCTSKVPNYLYCTRDVPYVDSDWKACEEGVIE